MLMYMDRNVDFSKMSNSELNVKLMTYDNEYDIRKTKIIDLVHELEDLDFLYIKAKEELEKRGVLNNG
jgi:hypothetical protein